MDLMAPIPRYFRFTQKLNGNKRNKNKINIIKRARQYILGYEEQNRNSINLD